MLRAACHARRAFHTLLSSGVGKTVSRGHSVRPYILCVLRIVYDSIVLFFFTKKDTSLQQHGA